MNSTKLVLASILAPFAFSAIACGPTIPPKELADARTQYQAISQGPAAQEDPAAVHTAKEALDKAESAFAKDGDEPQVRDVAYVALRKAELADSEARFLMAQKAKRDADAQAQAQMGKNLNDARSNLAKTQEQLDREKQARADAEKKMQMALADLNKLASVKQETRGMVITLSGSVLFQTDKSALLPAATAKMNEVADALIKGNPNADITVEGHTDSTGNKEHNMELSQQRAESVKAALVARGVAADRVKTVGVGPDRPIADNKSPEGRANNRRVEIIVSNNSSNSGPSSTK